MPDKNIEMIHDGEKTTITIPSCDEYQFNDLTDQLLSHGFSFTEKKNHKIRGYRNLGFFGTEPAILFQINKKEQGVLFELTLRFTLSIYNSIAILMVLMFHYIIFKYLLSSNYQSLILFLIFEIVIIYIGHFLGSLIIQSEKLRMNYDISKNAAWILASSRVKWNEIITKDLKNIFDNKIIQKDINPQIKSAINNKTKKILYKIGIIIFLFPMISSILGRILFIPYQVILEAISPGLINSRFGTYLSIFLFLWIFISTFFICRKIWRYVDKDKNNQDKT